MTSGVSHAVSRQGPSPHCVCSWSACSARPAPIEARVSTEPSGRDRLIETSSQFFTISEVAVTIACSVESEVRWDRRLLASSAIRTPYSLTLDGPGVRGRVRLVFHASSPRCVVPTGSRR